MFKRESQYESSIKPQIHQTHERPSSPYNHWVWIEKDGDKMQYFWEGKWCDFFPFPIFDNTDEQHNEENEDKDIDLQKENAELKEENKELIKILALLSDALCRKNKGKEDELNEFI